MVLFVLQLHHLVPSAVRMMMVMMVLLGALVSELGGGGLQKGEGPRHGEPAG